MRDAEQHRYAVGYFECWNLESLLAVADAARAQCSPVLMGFSGIYLSHPSRVVTDSLGIYAALGHEVCRELNQPACLLFNESPAWDWVLAAVRLGFGLVMYSDESLPPPERVRKIRELVSAAHQQNSAVEAELFALPGLGGDKLPEDFAAALTDVGEAQEFVAQTGIDALAVNVGQMHLHGRRHVKLDLDRVAAIKRAVDVPLVLHGATSVDRSDLRHAIEVGIRKVNVGSALKQVFFSTLRDACASHADIANPYEVIGSGLPADVLTTARQAMQRTVEDWLILLGSAGRGYTLQRGDKMR